MLSRQEFGTIGGEPDYASRYVSASVDPGGPSVGTAATKPAATTPVVSAFTTAPIPPPPAATPATELADRRAASVRQRPMQSSKPTSGIKI